MSRAAGSIERRIAELFAATRDHALDLDRIARHAFGLNGARPTRAQRLSATRAAHRLLRRVHEATAKLKSEPNEAKRQALYDFCERIGTWHRVVRLEGKSRHLEIDHWCAITLKGRLYFHPPDVPMRVWAVSIGHGGITWVEAEVTNITERNIMVRYAGEIARLNRRRLWHWWAWWRGVMFVSSRTGRIADKLDRLWWQRFGRTSIGAVPPSLQMPLQEARALLGVPENYTKADVLAAFRRTAKAAHPDAGGTAEMFRRLVEARERLLAAIGTKAPPPKPPTYAPKGAPIVYRSWRQQQNRLGSTTRLITDDVRMRR